MELNTEQQIFNVLNKAKKVLVALPEVLDSDSAASGLALMLFLKKMDKDVEIASSGNLAENLKFLPQSSAIKPDISSGSSLVVVVNTSEKKLEEISYQTNDDQVRIFLKGKNGQLTAEDVSFDAEKFPLDAVVVLGSRSLDNLGKLFERHAGLFFETPKINIDYHPGNEYFGAVNLIDSNASSVAEILSSLFEKYETQLMDEDIATCLLAGIITRTNSFQHARTTPKAFMKASELVSSGGRQQEVVKNVYKTKPLSLLRLWGRALARLKLPDNLPAVYSLLNMNDFAKAEAGAEDLPAVLKELVNSVSNYKVMAVVSEVSEGAVRVLAAVHAEIDLEKITGRLGGENKILENGLPSPFRVLDIFVSGISLAEAEQRFLEAIKSF